MSEAQWRKIVRFQQPNKACMSNMSEIPHPGQTVFYKLQIFMPCKRKLRSQIFFLKQMWLVERKSIQKGFRRWGEVDKGGDGTTGEDRRDWPPSSLQLGPIAATSKRNMISDKGRNTCRNPVTGNIHTDLWKPVSCVQLCDGFPRSDALSLSSFACGQTPVQQHGRLKELNTSIHYPHMTHGWQGSMDPVLSCWQFISVDSIINYHFFSELLRYGRHSTFKELFKTEPYHASHFPPFIEEVTEAQGHSASEHRLVSHPVPLALKLRALPLCWPVALKEAFFFFTSITNK